MHSSIWKKQSMLISSCKGSTSPVKYWWRLKWKNSLFSCIKSLISLCRFDLWGMVIYQLGHQLASIHTASSKQSRTPSVFFFSYRDVTSELPVRTAKSQTGCAYVHNLVRVRASTVLILHTERPGPPLRSDWEEKTKKKWQSAISKKKI